MWRDEESIPPYVDRLPLRRCAATVGIWDEIASSPGGDTQEKVYLYQAENFPGTLTICHEI
jgi:hypothetical protein